MQSAVIALTTFALLACGHGRERRAGDVTAADVVAGRAAAFEHFESPSGKFSIDFPPVWRGGYRAVERPDTVAGAHAATDFVYLPDPTWKVPPRPLLVIRVFSKAAWAAVAKRKIAVALGERGDDVFALSLASQNPYPGGTPAHDRFEEIMLSVVNDPVPLRLKPH